MKNVALIHRVATSQQIIHIFLVGSGHITMHTIMYLYARMKTINRNEHTNILVTEKRENSVRIYLTFHRLNRWKVYNQSIRLKQFSPSVYYYDVTSK